MKHIIVLCSVLFLVGCSMTITATEDECTLKGFGSGKGSIKDKCEVEKGLINFPEIRLDN